MLRTNPQYQYSKEIAINHPKYLTITGKLVKQEDESNSVENYLLSRESMASKTDRESINMLRDSTITTKKKKQKKVSALINVDVSSSQSKQLLLNMEFELTFYQGMIIKSMKMKYNPK